MRETKLTFLGASESVTGSRYLLEGAGLRILIDCGLFQGTKNLRLRNWSPLPIDVGTLDAVILTHAHLDHSGYLPVLVQMGYCGPVYCTRRTRDLCQIMLRDSARLQEEEAAYANRHGFSKHHPALPLYTRENAENALELLEPRDFDVPKRIFIKTAAFRVAREDPAMKMCGGPLSS
ncbi:Cft2 family RNA processing exonuclease [Paraburkholderia sp. 40]